MIDPAELMAMMTAHGIPLGHVAPGGLRRLTALDLAAAMGMAHVPTNCQMVTLAKLCLDENAKHQGWSFWFKDRMAYHTRNGDQWKPGQIETLAIYTLAEHLSPNTCKKCGGLRAFVIGELVRECPRCRGTGKQYPGDRAMARMFDVPRSAWERIWMPRVAEGRKELNRWEYEALVGLAQGLGASR